MKKIKLGAFISGGGTNLQAIIDACEAEKIDAEMVFVGTDNPAAKGLKRAQKHKIPYFSVDYLEIIKNFKKGQSQIPADFNMDEALNKQSLFSSGNDREKAEKFLASRAIAEKRLLDEMAAYSFDLLVLAGFMRNLTPYFIDHINIHRVNTNPEIPRIMNIHPAILPSFPGVDGYGDTFRYGCKIGGCTVHFIDYGEDSGPIIGQRSFPIEPTDSLDNIKEKGLQQEWLLYPECIQLFAEGRLKVAPKEHKMPSGKIFRRKVVEISPKP